MSGVEIVSMLNRNVSKRKFGVLLLVVCEAWTGSVLTGKGKMTMAKAEAWVMIPKLDDKKTGCVLEMKPLVLCKDCKWWKDGLCESDDVARKINDCGCYPDFRTDSDWFCYDGERR